MTGLPVGRRNQWRSLRDYSMSSMRIFRLKYKKVLAIYPTRVYNFDCKDTPIGYD